MKKKLLSLGLVCLCAVCMAVPVFATEETVYYKGSAVYWNHGRAYGVWSFSDVQSSVYEHSATANATSSGWQQPGVMAKASQKLAPWEHAKAYWNCRG